MLQLPDGHALLIRTDFTNDEAWQHTVDAASQPWDLGGGMETFADLTFVDDPAFDGLTLDDLRELTDEPQTHYFVFIADTVTLGNLERPILVVDTSPYRPSPDTLPTFRAVPSEMPAIENNLTLANMDFDDFASAVDADGVFRGFPEPEGYVEPEVVVEPEPIDWIQLSSGPDAGTWVRRSDLAEQAAQRQRAAWGGGEPISEVASFNGGQKLAQFDRRLVEQIVALDAARHREIAIWCAEQAFTLAGIADREAFRRGIADLRRDGVLTGDLADHSRSGELFRPFNGEETTTARSASISVAIVTEDRGPFPPRNIHKPSYAIPSFYAAGNPDPLRAAIEALFHATSTHVLDGPAALHQRLRLHFDLDSATRD